MEYKDDTVRIQWGYSEDIMGYSGDTVGTL